MPARSARRLESQGSIFQTNSDTEVIVHLIALSKEHTLPEAMADALRRVEGAFSLVMMSADRIFAARDPRGFRPLAMGRIPALGRAEARHDRVRLRNLRLRSDRRDLRARCEAGRTDGRRTGRHELAVLFAPQQPQSSCIFEHVYFSRPDSLVFGRPVQDSREELGPAAGARSSGRCRSGGARARFRRDRGDGLLRRRAASHSASA